MSRSVLPEEAAVLFGRAVGQVGERPRRRWRLRREEGGRRRESVDGRVGAAPRKVHRDARHGQVGLAHLANTLVGGYHGCFKSVSYGREHRLEFQLVITRALLPRRDGKTARPSFVKHYLSLSLYNAMVLVNVHSATVVTLKGWKNKSDGVPRMHFTYFSLSGQLSDIFRTSFTEYYVTS